MIALLAGCAGLPAALPTPAGRFAPTRLEVVGPTEPLRDVDGCGSCHEDQHTAWSSSAHAHASFDNPWYRASVDALRTEVGFAASRHCAGCHDPVLLVAGAMDAPVDPGQPDADAGVTCLMCHGAAAVTSDGNASLRVDLTDLPDPKDVQAHKARMLPTILEEGKVCAGCHRGFLGPDTGNRNYVLGMDDQGSWKGSSFAGADGSVLLPSPPIRASCVGCHFETHGAPGGQTALAAQTGGLEAVRDRLVGAASVRVGAVWVGGEPLAPALARGRVDAIDVVVWNDGTGHAFPGGTHDLQDTWLEVRALDADGGLVAVSGATPGEPDAARLKALVVDADGAIVDQHRTNHIVTAAFDRTVPPGGAVATRFTVPAGADVAAIEVRLLHRRHPAAFQSFACEATTADTLDGCLPEPVVEIGSDRVALGAGDDAFLRAWTHALALSADVSEHLDDARPSVARALALATTPREQAAAEWVGARIEAREGRETAAYAAAARAEALMGPNPALERVRGEAAAAVWDWTAAATAYGALAARSPGDTAAFRDLAKARGSAADPEGSLEAAVHGLSLQPRDPDLLLSESLALHDLGDGRADAAHQAWLDHRPPDDATALRRACDEAVPNCARDRVPVPVVTLSAP